MAFSVELLRNSQSCRTRTDDGYFFPCPMPGRTGFYHSFQKSDLRNRCFVFANGYGRFVQGKHARFFAGSRTNPPGKIGEVIGFVKNLHSFFPFSLVNHILPFRHTVAQRTSPMTERYSTVHATGSLHFPLFLAQGLLHFFKVCNSLQDRPVSRFFAGNGYKCFWITHFILIYTGLHLAVITGLLL